jgi:hypothetical protein
MVNIKYVITIAVVSLMVVGCGKKNEQPAFTPAKNPEQTSAAIKTIGTKTPEFLKGKWKSVKLSIYDKKTMKESIIDVNIGSSVNLPNSDVSIEVNNFFPYYILSGTDQTSEPNELRNPAVQLTVRQGASNITKGWIFGNFPDMNDKFNNAQIAIKLLGEAPN